jgi:hypothetical protein
MTARQFSPAPVDPHSHSSGTPERIRTPSKKIDFLRTIRGLGEAQPVRRAAGAGAGVGGE